MRLLRSRPLLFCLCPPACLAVALSAGTVSEGILGCLCVPALLVVGIIDGTTGEIPLGLNLLIGLLGVVRLALDFSCWQEHLAGMLAVSGILLMAYWATGGKGIGGGDIKLMAAAGLFLGRRKILLAFLTGGLGVLLVHPVRMRLKGRGRVLALGPYLSFGIFAAMLCGERLIKR